MFEDKRFAQTRLLVDKLKFKVLEDRRYGRRPERHLVSF